MISTKVVEALNKAIQDTPDYIWQVYLKQVIVGGMVDIFCALVMLVGVYYLTKALRTKDSDGDPIMYARYRYEQTELIIWTWTGNIIVFLWASGLIIRGILLLSNPAYYIFSDIIVSL